MAADLDRTLSALAEPHRRRVVDLLREQPRRASELADALSLSRPAMSRHLKLLRQSGLIQEDELEEDARVRMYRLCPRPFAQLRGWVEEVEAFWGEQLQSFKAHAERSARGRR